MLQKIWKRKPAKIQHGVKISGRNDIIILVMVNSTACYNVYNIILWMLSIYKILKAYHRSVFSIMHVYILLLIYTVVFDYNGLIIII